MAPELYTLSSFIDPNALILNNQLSMERWPRFARKVTWRHGTLLYTPEASELSYHMVLDPWVR